MRQLLTFTKNAAPRDASGGFGDQPQPQFIVRGKLAAIPRGKNEQYGPVNWTTAFTQFMATIRWRGDVTDDMSIYLGDPTVAGTRVFRVRNSPQVERSDRYMEILCEEVTS